MTLSMLNDAVNFSLAVIMDSWSRRGILVSASAMKSMMICWACLSSLLMRNGKILEMALIFFEVFSRP